MKNIAIIGSGTWGVALAMHLSNIGHNVKLWAFMQEEADNINIERKCKFLPDVRINDNITCYTDIQKVVEGTDMILHVTPSKFVRETIKKYKDYVTNQPIIMCAKGFEAETLCTLSQIIEQEMPNSKYGIFSGPSHAEEVSVGIPTAIVIASKDEEVRNLVQETFMNEKMRVYTSDDVKGAELGGALKNIIAFGAGMCDGLGYGDNAKAALMTRGITEMGRLGVAMGAHVTTFTGLSGIGDLIVTCTSMHSRNRRAGILMCEGKSLEETLKEVDMVVEGIVATEVAYKVGKKLNIDLPITNAIYSVLYENAKPEIQYNRLNSAFDKVYGKTQLKDDQRYVSYYVEDGDYWKIDNVTLGYTFKLSKQNIIKNLRIYASVLNLATITGYKGMDPEVPLSSNTYGLLDAGTDNRDKYPTNRTYTFGVNLTF